FSEPFLAHNVPDCHVDIHAAVRAVDLDLLLRHLRPKGGNVSVVELVLNEPADQTRLADRAFPDEADLDFHFLRSIGIPRGGSSLAHVSGYKGVAHRLSIEIMAVPIGAEVEIVITRCPGARWRRRGPGTPRSRRPRFSRTRGIEARCGSTPSGRALPDSR